MRNVINAAPTEILDVFVFGEGTAGQLGLGSASGDALQARAPRLNDNLAAEPVGVVQVSVGARHCAALTHDNRILTWGANSLGELGRRTDWSKRKGGFSCLAPWIRPARNSSLSWKNRKSETP
jgi:regulator of chromosome condensation